MTMKTIPLLFLAGLLAAATARAGIVEVDDQINARIARVKIDRGGSRNANEKFVDARKDSRETDLLGDGCNIALGNIIQPAQSGFATSARQQTTVVVQGDVIMANNRCK
jgi:hypothetical protein